jgi:hypothetical protein
VPEPGDGTKTWSAVRCTAVSPSTARNQVVCPGAPREPGPGERALAALYKKHADELGAIEAAYKAGPPRAAE